MIYLALPPALYQPAAVNLGKAGLSGEHRTATAGRGSSSKNRSGRTWTAPGELDRSLHAYFREHQIFRIDHYLAKETVQNILMFRFANSIFEPIWNRRYIDYVSIRAAETLGVEHRAGYYESAGVLRDMFQNHMMQLLSLTAMEPPPRFEAELVRDEKAKVFSALRPFPVGSIEEHLVLGQYAAGVVDGRPVPAYRGEEGVDPALMTPTYAAMKVYLDNWRWQGVPFFISSGKAPVAKSGPRSRSSSSRCRTPCSATRWVSPFSANRLILGIYPEEQHHPDLPDQEPRGRRVPAHRDHGFRLSAELLGARSWMPMRRRCWTACWETTCCSGGRTAVDLSWAFLSPVLDACETLRRPRPAASLLCGRKQRPGERDRLFRTRDTPNPAPRGNEKAEGDDSAWMQPPLRPRPQAGASALLKAALLVVFIVAAIVLVRFTGVKDYLTAEGLGRFLAAAGLWAPAGLYR